MPFTPQQLAEAQAVQHTAAHSEAPAVRLIAGPGSGKSHSIAERVRWLIDEQANAEDIAVVSFTRASVKDLKESLTKYGYRTNVVECGAVQVSTLHSLALKILKSAGLLEQYAHTPSVLGDYELKNIFDFEFGHDAHITSKQKLRDIRQFFAAYWNTGEEHAATYAPPGDPVSDAHKTAFRHFKGPACRVYSCVLLDELVRQCVENIESGMIDLRQCIRFRHLIVDEYQDFCAADIKLIDLIAEHGVNLFVAGDDDQSIYMFRHAAPVGIQRMRDRYPNLAEYALEANFRCGSDIVAAATALVANNGGAYRIQKQLRPLYANSEPPVRGTVHRWQFDDVTLEANAVARSCRKLIDAGVSENDILILLASASNQGHLWPPIRDALTAAGVPFVAPKEPGFTDSDAGALLKTLLAIAIERDENGAPTNAVAHRLLFGLHRRCGQEACAVVRRYVQTRPYTTYLSLFYSEEPPNLENGRAQTFLNSSRYVAQNLFGWDKDDTVATRAEELCQIVTRVLGNDADGTACTDYMAVFPGGMALRELAEYLEASDDAAKDKILKRVRNRLGEPEPEEPQFPPKVRVMTMHSAKGLTVKAAFIPGLEQGQLPSRRHLQYEAMIAEDARLLYVSMTRAQAACIMSCATNRRQGDNTNGSLPSAFLPQTNGRLERHRATGLTDAELATIMQDIANLS